MNLFFSDYIRIEDNIYFSALNFNGLFKYSLQNKETELMGVFKYEDPYKTYLHSKVLKYKNSIWFVPNNSKHIYEYNQKRETLNSYDIPSLECNTTYSLFLSAAIYGEKLILFPCRYKGIVVFDMEKKKTEKVFELGKVWSDSTGLFAFKGATIYRDKIIIASMCKNICETIDIASGERKVYFVEEDYGGITHLLVVEGKIVIIGFNGRMGVYSDNGQLVSSTDEKKPLKGHKFYDVCEKNGLVYLSETDDNKLMIYDTQTNLVDEVDIGIGEEKEFSDFWANVLFLKREQEGLLFQSAYDGYLYSFENETVNKLTNVNWEMSKNDYSKMKYNTPLIFVEQELFDLHKFIFYQ